MCFNVAQTDRHTQIYVQRYKNVLLSDVSNSATINIYPAFYFVSGFTHPQLPIVKHDGIFLFEWGLIPSWTKDSTMAINIRTKTLNAVGETVFDKPAFKKSIVHQRCLLGVSGFYEWRDVNKVKYPYFIQTKNNEIFSLGCIYDTWIDKSTGEIKNTFAILTTPANALLETIHNTKKRMPLILAPDDEKKWIDPNLTLPDIRQLIKPYSASNLHAYTVSKQVNNARNNRNIPESMLKVDYPELS
jgi:putative SOS response-associated peptidase YedK